MSDDLRRKFESVINESTFVPKSTEPKTEQKKDSSQFEKNVIIIIAILGVVVLLKYDTIMLYLNPTTEPHIDHTIRGGEQKSTKKSLDTEDTENIEIAISNGDPLFQLFDQ